MSQTALKTTKICAKLDVSHPFRTKFFKLNYECHYCKVMLVMVIVRCTINILCWNYCKTNIYVSIWLDGVLVCWSGARGRTIEWTVRQSCCRSNFESHLRNIVSVFTFSCFHCKKICRSKNNKQMLIHLRHVKQTERYLRTQRTIHPYIRLFRKHSFVGFRGNPPPRQPFITTIYITERAAWDKFEKCSTCCSFCVKPTITVQ